ncbi:ankyrin repeat domain-containing protein [Pseudomonas rubra]|uniref:Ankyrin repeat domain-containing protein n=1 Tax=Pseudomonas rubra TaxID=2942627 RepID=A0ABT5P745_9PSED|nr:ankyrin repeat domain-containing protein [Pseudomonas rubra]MDD1014078.1 ankyrin repeat domain-containing protein [Pseudomonas rubra]MDD1039012.1 ankyrin repeat domain-containing protein [Pseudomonas rubra]MDD1154234.1 ankyrin repeat domain-containing protein [Pseudomonas rubra]
MSRIRFARKTAALALALAACALPGAAFASAAELSKQLYNEVGEYKYDETPARLAKIQALLDQGADPKGQPMFLAASYKIVAPFELFLPKIDAKAPIQENGETLLLFVLNQAEQSKASEADLRMVKGLIKAGADVNVIAQGDSATPLNTAARKGSPELIKLLLASGADAKAVRPNGFTPLTGPGASNLEVIKLLVAAGANPYQVTLTGTTPLHHVCERAFEMNGQPDPQAAQRIALLLKKGSSIDAYHEQQGTFPVGTPLQEAARMDNPDCVAALIKAGASLKAPAFPESYLAKYPQAKQKTVQEYVLSAAEESPTLYTEEVVKLFK